MKMRKKTGKNCFETKKKITKIKIWKFHHLIINGILWLSDFFFFLFRSFVFSCYSQKKEKFWNDKTKQKKNAEINPFCLTCDRMVCDVEMKWKKTVSVPESLFVYVCVIVTYVKMTMQIWFKMAILIDGLLLIVNEYEFNKNTDIFTVMMNDYQ